MKKTLLTSAAMLGLVSAASAANIAIGGIAIMGTDTTLDPASSSPFTHVNNFAGISVTAVNDGDTTVIVDTWAGDIGGDNTGIDFVGVTGLTIAGGEAITGVTLVGNNFGDGGWFGTNGDATTASAIAPTIQISSDGGITWSDLTGVSDTYTADVNTVGSGGGEYTSTFSFAGVTGVDALRLVGTTGGNAGGDANGFIGIRELQINTSAVAVPEPSSAALLGLGGIALILRRRK